MQTSRPLNHSNGYQENGGNDLSLLLDPGIYNAKSTAIATKSSLPIAKEVFLAFVLHQLIATKARGATIVAVC